MHLIAGSMLASWHSTSAFAVAGPSASVEGSQKSPVERLDTDEKINLSMSTTKETLELIAPVGEIGGGTVALKYIGRHESRKYFGADLTTDNTAKFRELSSSELLGIYANKTAVPMAHIYLIAGRLGLRDLTQDVRPMTTAIGVVSINLADFGLKIFPGEDDRTTFILKRRDWAFGHAYTPVVQQKISLGEGFTFELGIVSHVRLDWTSSDHVWSAYTVAEGNSQNTPVRVQNETFWVNGHYVDLIFGLRRQAIAFFYGALEGGLHQDHSTYTRLDGTIMREQQTEFSPWTRFAIETEF
jgi:hypothetical protein